jgi:hypothetical protein
MVACIDFFEMSEICRPKFIVRHSLHNRPDIIILNKQQKQAYLLDIAVPNSHNITDI